MDTTTNVENLYPGGEEFHTTPSRNLKEKDGFKRPKRFEKEIEDWRSIRPFDADEVSEEIVNKCFKLALLAPNSSILQPWEFFWVRTPKKKEALLQACQPYSLLSERDSYELFVATARTNTWKANIKRILKIHTDHGEPKSVINFYKKLLPSAYEKGPISVLAPLKKLLNLIVGFFREIPGGQSRLGQSRINDMKVWAVKSTALACQNLMLSFRAYGYDTRALEVRDMKIVKKVINLPKKSHVVMVISVGKISKEGALEPLLIFPREEVIKEI